MPSLECKLSLTDSKLMWFPIMEYGLPARNLGSKTVHSSYVQNYYADSQYTYFFRMRVRFLQGCNLCRLTKKKNHTLFNFGPKDPEQCHIIVVN